MSTIKVDTIATRTGSGNITLSNNVASLTSSGAISGTNITASGTLAVTGATTTAGITSSAAHTVTTSTHANASVFKSTGNTQIMLQDTDASANDQFWGLQNSGGEFNILTCNDDRASGFVTPMTITQAGHVKQPNQPSFCARLNSYPAMDIATVPFETVLHNVGNHYNNSNYRFTAPVTGRYYLSYSVRVNHGTSGHIIHPVFFINGSSDTTSRTIYKNDTNAQYMATTFSYIRQLSANDYVTVNMSSGNGGGTMQTGQCSFTGHLLG